VAKIANAALTLKRGNAVVVQAEVTPIDHRCPAEWLAGRTSHFVHRKNMHDAFLIIALQPHPAAVVCSSPTALCSSIVAGEEHLRKANHVSSSKESPACIKQFIQMLKNPTLSIHKY